MLQQYCGPTVHAEFLLIWLGLTLFGVALKSLRSWLAMFSILIPVILFGSCVWLWGRYGIVETKHTWLAGAVMTLGFGLIAALGASVFRKKGVRAPSLISFITLAVFWPFLLSSALRTIAMLVGLIKVDLYDRDGQSLEGEEANSDEAISPPAPAATEPQPGPFTAQTSVPSAFTEQAARSIQETHQQLWSSELSIVPVDSRDYPHADKKFYENTRKLLEGYGFRFLGDVDFKKMRVPLVLPTMVRQMVSPDGLTYVFFYQCKASLWIRALTYFTSFRKIGNSKVTDFDSEFDDGSFVMTSNSQAASKFNQPETINQECYPDRSVEDLGSLHYQRIVDHANARNCRPLVFTTQAQINQSAERSHAIKSQFRSSKQGLSREEFRRASGSDSKTTDEIYDVWQQVRREGGPNQAGV